MVYSQDDVKKLGNILGIWAHPDDESWSSAGLMKMAALNGQKLGIITATKGESGETADEKKWPKHKLHEIREQELADCLCHIGAVEQFWLDYKDGKLAESDRQIAVDEIVKVINVFKPDTIVTFEPNGVTGHDDHRTISLWSTEAVRSVSRRIRILHTVESEEKFELAGSSLDSEFNIFFNIDKPVLVAEKDADVLLKLSGEILKCKICCMKAHASQTSTLFVNKNGQKMVEIMAATECFIDA